MVLLFRALVGVLLLISSTAHADSNPIDYAHLKQVIQSESIGSFDELLEYFKLSPDFEPLLENPVLNERSKALHGSLVSASFPRIIMHGGNLAMMILGNPKLDESQFLEIIEFLPSTRTFAFRAINFHAKGTDEEFIDDANTVHFEKLKDPTFKTASNCFNCHQMEAKESRPRWMTGPIWQTPFGEVENTLHFGSRDFENWKLFKATYADANLGARYRALKLSKINELKDGSLVFADQPNQKLTDFLDVLNAQRIARIIDTSSNYLKYEPAIIASYFSCGPMSEFLTPTEVTLRETSVRAAIAQAGRGVYTRGREKIDLFDSVRLKAHLKETWRFPKDDPSVIVVDDQEFLQLSDLSLEEILAKTVRSTSDVSLVTAISEDNFGGFLPVDFMGLIQNGVDFSKLTPVQIPLYLISENQNYYATLAKLRYLLEDSVEEKPIFWSISKSSPFGDSYDFGDSVGGLWQIIDAGLGQHFLANYPEFKTFFLDEKISSKTLSTNESDLCSALKAAQSRLLQLRL